MRPPSFDIITEADARQIERGATVELRPGGHVTPLARDTLQRPPRHGGARPVPSIRRCRRTWRRRPTSGAWRSPAITPASRCSKRDRAAPARARGLAVDDLGIDDAAPVDYPDTAARVASAVARGEADAGIVIDGAGIGSAIAANKVRGIRAAMATDETIARYAREHNGANVLTLGSTLSATGRRAAHRRRLARHADDGSAIYSTAGEDPAARRSRSRCIDARSSDLQRLVEIITEEVMAAQRRAGAGAVAVQLPRGALRLLSRTGCAACSTPAPRASACTRRGGAAGTVAGDDRSHAAQARRDAHRTSRSSAARRREFHFATVCVNPTWVALCARAAARHRRRRLLGRRLSARRDDRRRQALRDAGARSSTARARSTW